MDVSSTGKSWNTDWTKCSLCQEVKKEDRKFPQANPARRGDDGYINLAKNIPLFHSLNALPIKLDPARLDEGGRIDETLRQKKALYHERITTGIPRTVIRLLQSTWACMCLPRQGIDKSLKCSMRKGSIYHSTESYKAEHC